ncbi:hypothetical protein RhiLY_11762 [Ceratobasidium sp. AG-Ba]|nr:hypothetical protein RhiLY_11762 [Ceratobasidium sp. AG-Ba]
MARKKSAAQKRRAAATAARLLSKTLPIEPDAEPGQCFQYRFAHTLTTSAPTDPNSNIPSNNPMGSLETTENDNKALGPVTSTGKDKLEDKEGDAATEASDCAPPRLQGLGSTQISKHQYVDGSLRLQVDGTSYHIHRHILEISPILTNFVDGHQASSASCQLALLSTNPTVVLSLDIKSAELEALLDFLYTPFYAIDKLPFETYRLALVPSIKWEFAELRDTILKKLECTMGVVERLILAQELHVSSWKTSCLTELVTRSGGLTLDEGRRLGMETVIFVSGAREEARVRTQCSHPCGSCGTRGRSIGGSMDTSFVQDRIKEWVLGTKQA